VDRHSLLEEFLRLIGVDEDNIQQDVEGIEHHLSWESINCLSYLIQYLQADPVRIEELHRMKREEEQKEA
jgi:Mn-dependent DtxR family transcriptional regulator